ncbi:hypothetical protein BV25DRAFT_224539 [Artomyces pyxidatus]|uniref:Uncharacterized protein n=1 Tax=Artomyces pyxidatus TaxID=48021 RepID=A0ACB8T9Z9_9AGAM|nr:hypothetical protein BV25DRAFT_224539 [Artomyces pyxidatus]
MPVAVLHLDSVLQARAIVGMTLFGDTDLFSSSTNRIREIKLHRNRNILCLQTTSLIFCLDVVPVLTIPSMRHRSCSSLGSVLMHPQDGKVPSGAHKPQPTRSLLYAVGPGLQRCSKLLVGPWDGLVTLQTMAQYMPRSSTSRLSGALHPPIVLCHVWTYCHSVQPQAHENSCCLWQFLLWVLCSRPRMWLVFRRPQSGIE